MLIRHFLFSAMRIFFLLATVSSLSAQNVTDALRYSFFEYGGTARFTGLGGAMSAIGADLSTASTNPAGIAWIQNSEYTITPGLLNTTTQSRLLDGLDAPLLEDQRGTFNIQNLGMVFVSKPQTGKWRGANFAITFNHLGNFNREFSFEGVSYGSLTQRYKELANSGLGLDDYETSLANDASAIYDFEDDGVFEIDYDIPTQTPYLFKEQFGTTRGSMSELGFTLGANYDDKVMFGFSVGVPFFSFTSDKTYQEEDDTNIPNGGAIPYFTDLQLREELVTTGGGVNAKFGIILRPHQHFRIGAAVHTPTVYTLNDDYETTLTYNYYEDAKEEGAFLGKTANSPGNFEYRLNTPWRVMGGLGIFLGSYGFLSGEVEFVDYSKSGFRYDGFEDAENAVNRTIRDELGDVLNFRVGGEIAYDIFRFRAGLNRLPSPYLNDDSSRFILSGGMGLRMNKFYLDFAYRHTKQEERYYPYLTDEAPIQEVLSEFSTGSLLMTMGFKF